MNRRNLWMVVSPLIALLLALLLHSTRKDDPAPSAAAADRKTEAAKDLAADETGPAAETGTAEAAPVKELKGLRLLTTSDAEARGWKSPIRAKSAEEILTEAARNKWESTQVSLNLSDATLEDLVSELERRYGLLARIDEKEVEASEHTVSFRVSDLRADQTVDLILKMADLGWYLDVTGVLWITSKERSEAFAALSAPAVTRGQKWTSSMVRGARGDPSKRTTMATRRAAWMMDRTVSVSIANKSVYDAVTELAEAAGVTVYGWTEGAQAAAEKAPIASVVGENLPVEEAIESILAPAGIALAFWGNDGGQFATTAELQEWNEWEKQGEVAAKEEARARAELSARRVRIEGKVLTLRDVAAQLEAQLGEKVIVMPALENCAAVWEADGLEQSAGEVLNILGRDAPLDWGWMPEIDPEDIREGPHLIWLVDKG